MDMNAWLWAYCEITFSSLGRGWVTVCSWPHTALLLMALSENRGCQPQGNTPRLSHACREALVGGFEVGTSRPCSGLGLARDSFLLTQGVEASPGLYLIAAPAASDALGGCLSSVPGRVFECLASLSLDTLPGSFHCDTRSNRR